MSVDTDRADQVAHAVAQTFKAARNIKNYLPGPGAGLDHSAYPVLFVLDQEPARISAVAETIGSDISTISRQVAGLIDAGLAVRTPDPADGRAHLVTLTESGRAAIARTRQVRAEWFREVLHDWSDAELDHLVNSLNRLRDSLTNTHLERRSTRKDLP